MTTKKGDKDPPVRGGQAQQYRVPRSGEAAKLKATRVPAAPRTPKPPSKGGRK